jgi:hypothetical protein
LSSLLIEDFSSLPISRTFFASLSYTKKLKIVFRGRVPVRPEQVTNFEELAVGLLLMPIIEELFLISLPIISNFPKTLRLLDVTFSNDFRPNADFFNNICRLDALEELRLYDTISIFPRPSNSDELLQITEPQLPNLRIIDVCAYRISGMQEMFCSKILRSCSSLQDVSFSGVDLTNETFLSAASSSLRNLSLEDHRLVSSIEQPDEFEQPEEIQFSTLCTLFKRNPRIPKLQLSFRLGLAPLTYEIIDSISNSCPRLEHVSMPAVLTELEHFYLIKHPDAAYELSSVYSRSSPTNDMVVKGVLLSDGPHYWRRYEHQFILDLTKFRKLRDSDAVERSGIDVPGK